MRASAAGREIRVDDHPSGLGWTADGRLLVVLMRRRAVVAVDDAGDVAPYADLSGFGRGPANDLIGDGTGRVWVGYLGFDMAAGETPATTDLVRIEPDGSVHLAATGLMTPNGAALLDGATLLVAETLASRVTAFTVAADGELHGRRVFTQLAPEPPYDDLRTALRALRAAPDGVALDRNGRLWAADAATQGCVVVDRHGVVAGRVAAPDGLQVFACAVGGADLGRLLVCCAPDAVERRRSGGAESRMFVGGTHALFP